jgi:hypothetical protein
MGRSGLQPAGARKALALPGEDGVDDFSAL